MNPYRELFGSVYRYLTRRLGTTTVEEWEAAAEDASSSWAQFQGTELEPLATELYVAIYTELERRYKKEAREPRQE